jgi:PAS domain S-box-containing protein
LRATLDSTTDGILVVDSEGRIVSFNQRFVEMWSLPPEVMGTGLDEKAVDFVLDQLVDPDAFTSRISELYSKPEAESYDYLEFKNHRVFERFSQPQREHGVPVGRVWSFRDVTERRQLENARQRFIMDAVHELRSPIAVLTGMAELLGTRRADLADADLDNLTDKMGKQGTRLSRLVARMLDLGRIESRAQKSDLVPVDVREAVAEVLEGIPAPEGKSVSNEVPTGVTVLGDKQAVEQVLINLLTNAYRYGGNAIRVETERGGERISIRVFDDGPGIDPALVPVLFEPFQRGSKSSHADSFGLGLAIVRTLAASMGGEVNYDPVEGRGSCFSLTLPSAPSPPEMG